MSEAIFTATTTDQPDSDVLGPGAALFWHRCWEQQPITFGFAWITAPLLAVTAVYISFQHNQALRKVPVTSFRQMYLRCTGLPMVYAALNLFVVMTTPRGAQLQNFNIALYQAFVLSGFGNLLFQLLTLESYTYQDANASASRDASDRVLRALAAQGPQKHFAKPPLGCCFGSCMQAHDLSSGQLLACFMMLMQYNVVLPMLTVGGLYAALVAPDQFQATNQIIEYIAKISEMTAIWGLVVLYFATHDVLDKWKTTKKFVSLKIILAVEFFQEPIIGMVVGHLDGPLCLKHHNMVAFWNCWFLLAWSVFLAVLIRRAFPPNEVMSDDDGLYIPGNFEIDLRRHFQRSRAERPATDRSDRSDRFTDSIRSALRSPFAGGASPAEQL